MKRKTLTLAISIFALIAIVSVGFASWVISRPADVQSNPGSITAEAVTDESYNLVLSPIGASTIHFGKSNTAPKSTDWLTNTSGSVESLEYSLIVTADKYEFMDSVLYINLLGIEGAASENNKFVDILAEKNDNTENKERAFYTALTAGYIATPKVQYNEEAPEDYVSNTVLTVKEVFGAMAKFGTEDSFTFKTVKEIETAISESKTIVFENSEETKIENNSIKGKVYCNITIKFGWGTVTNAQNPLDYYNAQDYDAKKDEAKTLLEKVYAIATAETQYKVTISKITK